MKQTVQEAAKEMCEAWGMEDNHGYGVKDTFQVGFAQGAQWQSQQSPWIKAKDRLPDVDENDISEQSEPVLVKVSAKGHYEPEILVYNKHYHVWDTADADDYSCEISDDDLWMPIPALPKGGEEWIK